MRALHLIELLAEAARIGLLNSFIYLFSIGQGLQPNRIFSK